MFDEITLSNIIINGSFEVNTTGWAFSGTSDTRLALPSSHGEYGAWCCGFSGNQNANTIYSRIISALSIVSGRKYYIRALVRIGQTGYANQFSIGNGSATALTANLGQTIGTANAWMLFDDVWTANSGTLQLQLNFNGGNGNNARNHWFDNVMVVDLTNAFGAGNEASREKIREIVGDNGGYWDGAKMIEIAETTLKTFLNGKRIGRCFMGGKEIKEIYSQGKMVYKRG